MKNIVFLSGLPRTGSTVLASMLNQHPDIIATTTSPVADFVSLAINNWHQISGAVKNPHPNQFGNILTNIIQGSHRHETKSIVVDKNRLWPRFASVLYRETKVKPKIICTVRNIPDILASYILLIQRNVNTTFIDRALIDNGMLVNNKTRCQILLEKFINHPYTSLKLGYNSGSAEMLFINYDDIVSNGQDTVDKVCNFIGCPTFTLDKNNLQSMDENDEFHGGIAGLHEVRPVLSKLSPPPEKVLGVELANTYRNMKLEFWNKKSNNLGIPSYVEVKSESTPTEVVPDFLEGDSLDYDLLYRAAVEALSVRGLYCEIGVRRGGSLRHIIDAIHNSETDEIKHIIAIDPYGNIEYNATEQFKGKLDYTNDMKNESLPNIYSYANKKKVNVVFFNLEDTEFFSRFEYGVPVYNEVKTIIDNYAFVFFDGPHDVKSIERELNFFIPKLSLGSVCVFDDVATYPHHIIHQRLLDNGFEVLEIGAQGRKISYKLKTLNKTRLH